MGPNTPILNGTGSDSLIALNRQTNQFVYMRVPYPLGFYTRGMDFRIDDPKAGWKGRERTIVVSASRDRIMTQGPPPGVSPYFDHIMDGQEGSEEAVNSRGLNAIFSYKQLRSDL